jgi:hypothetical protein
MLVSVLGGCANSSSVATGTKTTATVAAVSQTTPAVAPTTASVDYGARAERVVRAYYDALGAEDFATAWGRLEPQVQAQFGGFDAWKNGFANTVSISATATATTASSSAATVAVRLRSKDLDACGDDVVQHFRGTWRLERIGGRWRAHQITMEKTGGGTPVTDVAECDLGGSPSADSGDPCDPSSTAYDSSACDESTSGGNTGSSGGDGCDPNYEGACLDPNAYDYDCAGGSGDGPEYVDGPVDVVGDDHFGLDRDGDGIGCDQ